MSVSDGGPLAARRHRTMRVMCESKRRTSQDTSAQQLRRTTAPPAVGARGVVRPTGTLQAGHAVGGPLGADEAGSAEVAGHRLDCGVDVTVIVENAQLVAPLVDGDVVQAIDGDGG